MGLQLLPPLRTKVFSQLCWAYDSTRAAGLGGSVVGYPGISHYPRQIHARRCHTQGSTTSRSPSPMRFHPMENSTMAAIGGR